MDTICVIHWGRNGGGVRFSSMLLGGIRRSHGGRVLASYAQGVEDTSAWHRSADDFHEVYTYDSVRSFLLGWHRWLLECLRIRRWLKSEHVSVLVSPMFSLWHSLGIWIILPRGVRYIAAVHDAENHPGESDPIRSLCRWNDIQRSDVLVTFSEHVHREITARAPGKIVRLGFHPLDKFADVRARSLPVNRPIRLGFVGRISKYKGIGLFVDAARMLAERGFELQFIVCGEGDISAVDQSSTTFIEWRLGWISEGDLRSRIEDVDIIVLPYIEASQSGVACLAASLGTPFVVTPVGGLPEQADATGCGIVTGDVSGQALADSIALLIETPGLYETLSAAGVRASQESMSWETLANICLQEAPASIGVAEEAVADR